MVVQDADPSASCMARTNRTVGPPPFPSHVYAMYEIQAGEYATFPGTEGLLHKTDEDK